MSKLVEELYEALATGCGEYMEASRLSEILSYIELLSANQIPEGYVAVPARGAQPADPGTTHFDGCHGRGPKHYGCALQRIERLESAVQAVKAWDIENFKEHGDFLLPQELRKMIQSVIRDGS